jgi:hypothetical protein
MTATLTRSEIRQRIDHMEALESVLTAIDDVSSVEWEPGDGGLLDLNVTDRSMKKAPVSFVHALPQEVVLAGLQAMRKALEEKL